MPQLDKFTYFSQFFWLCIFFFTLYIAIYNNGDGLLGISRILKLRNQRFSILKQPIAQEELFALCIRACIIIFCIFVSFGVFALFCLDYSILHRLLIKAFLLCLIIHF